MSTVDTAVHFGYGDWPGHVAVSIMSEDLQVVCSPRITDDPYPLVDYDMLTRHPLIRHGTRPRSREHWFRSTGIDPTHMNWGLQVESYFMVLQAAISGLGVTRLPTILPEPDLAAGNLVAPYPVRVKNPGAFYLVTPEDKQDLPRVRAFQHWIKAEAWS